MKKTKRYFSKQARKAWLKKYTGVKRPAYIGEIISKHNIEHKTHLFMKTPEAEFKRFLSMPRGSKHHLWNGSISNYTATFGKALKEAIKRRDGFKCTKCGAPQEELLKAGLVIHHIDHNKNNNSSDNLISLCRSCHLIVHYEDRKSVAFQK